MNWFKMINSFYPRVWTKSMVGDAVIMGKLTPEEYKTITGDDYVAPVA